MAQANIKAVITAEDRASAILKGFSDRVESMGASVVNVAKRGAVAMGAAATAATGFAIKSAADFEQTRIGLENMLGSADKARAVLSEVSKFAADTPFEFPELAGSVKQLIAFGFSGEDAIKTMKQLGDVSAAIGAPIGDLSYLMGTLKTQGRAFTIDIRQFAQRGVPIYEYLAKVLNTNEKALTGMIEAGKVGFPEVQKAFELMTSEGGKFHGTMAKQSKSLSGLFSTLKDNIGQTARELVGITQTGDIKAGSLFDRVRNGAAWLIENLPRAIQIVKDSINQILPTLQQWATNIQDVAIQVGDYLLPKFEALYNTIRDKIMPILNDLWHNVIEPLIPVFGTLLVVAIGGVVDILNGLLDSIAWVVKAIQDGNPFVIALAGAFGLLAAEMAFTQVFNALTIGFNTLRLITIPNVMASVGALQSLIALPTVFGAIGIGAALAALAMVYDAAMKTKQAIDDTLNATRQAGSSNEAVIGRLQALVKNGTPQQQEAARRALAGLAQQGSFATGGYTGAGGINEVAGIVHKGEYVVPQSQVDQSTGMPKMGSAQTVNITVQAGAFMGSQQDARQYAQMIMDAWNDLQSMGTARRTA